jgi:hypothetical protein
MHSFVKEILRSLPRIRVAGGLPGIPAVEGLGSGIQDARSGRVGAFIGKHLVGHANFYVVGLTGKLKLVRKPGTGAN